MAYEYKIGGLNIISINEVAPATLQKLSEAMRLARGCVKDALLRTQFALQVMRQASVRHDPLSFLHPTFAEHIQTLFRLTTADEVISALVSMNESLQVLAGGMSSPELRLAEFGYYWFAPKEAQAYVRMPVSWIMSSDPAPNGCLNTNTATFKNKNDVNIRFNKIPIQTMDYIVDTLIHECTHKFLGTYDLAVGGLPFKSLASFARECRGMGVPVPLGPLANLSASQAIRDAYVVTNYIQYCPDVDLQAHAITIATSNRAIGGITSNRRVFDSIDNDGL